MMTTCKNCGRSYSTKDFSEQNRFCSTKCKKNWYRQPNTRVWSGRTT